MYEAPLTDNTPPQNDEAKKRPAFQFYPADWRSDVELRSCSLAARGLWIDLMCVMHNSEPYGHLTLNGRAMTPAQIVNQIGGSVGNIRKLLDELIANGVARCTDEGVIFSKRMVDDERKRNVRANGGAAGAEHGAKGAEHGKKGGRPAKQKGGSETPLAASPKPPPSSSSSSSSNSVSDETGPAGADRSVDKSDSGLDERAESKRILRQDARDWLIAGGLTARDAQVCINAIAASHPDICEAALREAIKVKQRPGEAESYLRGIVRRMAADVAIAAVPAERAEKAVEATQALLRQQEAHTAEPAPAAVRASLAELRTKFAAGALMPTAPTTSTDSDDIAAPVQHHEAA